MSAGGSPSGAALPWAASSSGSGAHGARGDAARQGRDQAQQTLQAQQQEQQQAATEEPEPQAGHPVDAFGLAIGSRIEVRWDVRPAEGEAYSTWWGARVDRAAEAEAARAPGAPEDAVEGPSYVLAYDACAGFDAEERVVQFFAEHELLDTRDGDVLHWRADGCDWAPPEEATLKEIVDSLPAEEDMRAAEAEALGGLDAATQLRVLANFRDYADGFRAFVRDKLAAAAAAGQEEFVVTADMVREFTGRKRASAAP